jgi:hypothetical protein
MYDWMSYPDGLTGWKDSILKWVKSDASSKSMFARDVRSACALFLPRVEHVMSCLCHSIEHPQQTAEDLLKDIHLLLRRPAFAGMSVVDIHAFFGEVK